jgi:hypothetical protein
MALDPNIALGVRPLEVPNQLAQYGQLQQIMAAQDAQQINALKMQESRAALDERNALRRLDPTSADYESQLFKVNPTLGISFRKEKSATEASNAAAAASLATAAKEKQKITGQAWRDISSRPSDANITAHLEDISESILYSTAEKESITKTALGLLAMPFAERKAVLAQQGATTTELKPSTQTVNRSGSTDIVQVPAFSGAPTTVGSYADVPLPANVQAQKIEIARQSRPPRAEAQPSAPVAVVDEATGKIKYVSREDAINKSMTPASAIESLPPKEIQKREAALPQARQSVKTISNTMSVIGQTVDSLLANPDGIDGITGLVYGVTPAITGPARKAKAELDQLKNLAFIQGITELRAASKTGAAVGNVTNREGDRFENLKASLDRSQSKEDLIAALEKLKTQAELTSQFTTEAFDDTYSYKSAAPAAPAAGQGTGGFKYLGKENK